MKKLLLSLSIFFFTTISFSQNALSLDGTNDYVNCGTGTSLNITGTAITMEAWIYPTSWRTNIWQGNVISKEGTGTGYMLRVGAGGKLNMNVGNGPGAGTWNELSSSTTVLTLNTWQHIAGTYDGSYLRLYVNGIVTDSLAKTVTMTGSNTINLLLGTSPYDLTRTFPGKIDEVRIWNVARTKAHINADMNNELCSVPSSVKAYYNLNQGVAGGVNTTVTTATDYSGNSNTGTLVNFSLSGTSSNWVTGQTLVPGVVVNTINVSACGSYTMPNGSIITIAGTYYDTLPSSTPCDSLIGYNISFPAAIISNTINDVGCVNYTTALGNIITTSGTYYDTISTGSGCDTTVEYIITISGPVDDSVFRVGGRMDSYDTWAAHQWVRCDSNFKPIIGATNRFYIATQPGDYAVIVTRGSCLDTSDCINIALSNIEEIDLNNFFSVYPNPSNQWITIDSEIPLLKKNIKIYTTTGILVNDLTSVGKKINVESLTSGIYVIQINFDEKIYFSKFVKK